MCETPFVCMTLTPPIWLLLEYTFCPISELSAWKPVRMMGAPVAFWIVRCPRRTRYAPMPTERPATSVSVSTSSYAREVSPAMVPEPRRFSTPMSCSVATGRRVSGNK